MNPETEKHTTGITDRERAAFEAGIKLGGIFHQFTGTPVSPENAEEIERAIEAAVRVQPFVKEITVKIDREMLGKRCGKGTGRIGDGYTSLTGEMLSVKLTVVYRDINEGVKGEDEGGAVRGIEGEVNGVISRGVKRGAEGGVEGEDKRGAVGGIEGEVEEGISRWVKSGIEGGVKVTAGMKYDKSLDYPLMYLERITDNDK